MIIKKITLGNNIVQDFVNNGIEKLCTIFLRNLFKPWFQLCRRWLAAHHTCASPFLAQRHLWETAAHPLTDQIRQCSLPPSETSFTNRMLAKMKGISSRPTSSIVSSSSEWLYLWSPKQTHQPTSIMIFWRAPNGSTALLWWSLWVQSCVAFLKLNVTPRIPLLSVPPTSSSWNLKVLKNAILLSRLKGTRATDMCGLAVLTQLLPKCWREFLPFLSSHQQLITAMARYTSLFLSWPRMPLDSLSNWQTVNLKNHTNLG